MTRPVALVTGITGQDGSYLAEFLINKGYVVHGVIRRSSTFNTTRIDHLFRDPHEEDADLVLHFGDLTDGSSLRRILDVVQPDEIYNLGAQSHVRVSFDMPEYTVDTVGMGTLRLLEAIREMIDRTGKPVRLYQASSSEIFGSSKPPQSETSAFLPRSPYACAKVYAYYQVANYREAYGLYACNGILFNHESPRRGETFVTRKITRAATRIKLGLQKVLYLGNLAARRDWGYAGDYVEAMWLMLNQATPADYVIATGESHSVQEFVEEVFGLVDLDWREWVRVDPRYFRPTEVEDLRGDSTKARSMLGWTPRVGFRELARMMVDSDMILAKQEQVVASDLNHR